MSNGVSWVPDKVVHLDQLLTKVKTSDGFINLEASADYLNQATNYKVEISLSEMEYTVSLRIRVIKDYFFKKTLLLDVTEEFEPEDSSDKISNSILKILDSVDVTVSVDY